MIQGVASEVVVPALPDFFARYPDIALELGCSDRPIDLIEEGVDCAVRGGELADSTLIARRVGIIRFDTCATPSYIAQHGRVQHPHDLQEHRCVNYLSSKTGKVNDWNFNRAGDRIVVPMRGRIALNDSSTYASAGLAGLGIVQIPSFTLAPHLAAGRLELLLPEWHSDSLPIHVVYPQNRHLSAKVRVFVEWIAEHFLQHPEMQRQSLLSERAEG